ncbi:MAG: hypothetical protein HZA19_00615, partial [Nitrospirae bacterium]|nr:hypothetical protein [Nitrospirota bacterium]
EADKLSHRIGILHRGSIKIIDTPDALKNGICGDSVNFSFDQEQKEKAETVLKQHPLVKELLPENDHLRVYVDRGSEAVPGLMATLSDQGLTALSVTLSRPTLDDVYLKYSGVGFKDDATASGEANPWWAKWQKKGGSSGKKWGNWEEAGQSAEGDTTVEGPSSQGTDSPSGGGDSQNSPNWEEEWKKWNPGSKPVESKQETAGPSQWPNQSWGSDNGNGTKPESEHSGSKPWEKWQASEPNQGSEKKEAGDSAEKAEWAKWQDQWKQKKG